MNKVPPASRSGIILVIETIVWMALAFYARNLLDQAAAQGQIPEQWLAPLKVGVVVGLVIIALVVHALLFRWLIKRGVVLPEKRD
jgi:hypothetical protein